MSDATNDAISVSLAFKAMFQFLLAYSERGSGADTLIEVLSAIQVIHEDGRPADPAMWHDWLEAVRKAG
jgi:hypothetical protein